MLHSQTFSPANFTLIVTEPSESYCPLIRDFLGPGSKFRPWLGKVPEYLKKILGKSSCGGQAYSNTSRSSKNMFKRIDAVVNMVTALLPVVVLGEIVCMSEISRSISNRCSSSVGDMVCPQFLTFLCVSRCGPLLSGPRSGLRPLLLPQHHTHSTLAQQTHGPGDGLTNTFPRTHTLQRSQETPHTQQTHAHRRFLGHPVVSMRRTLGVK